VIDEQRKETIKVMIVDDHHLFRSGLRRLLEDHDEIEIVAEAPSADAALPLVKRRRPDVVMMDLSMPGLSGAEATGRVSELAPEVRVVVLTVSGAEDDVIDSLEAGAAGYLLKDAQGEEIVRAIAAASAGGAVLSPAITRLLIERTRRTARGAAARGAAEGISADELEVLRLLAEGKDNAAIAEELFMSLATAKRHVSSLLTKLGAVSRVQAAIKAVRAGII
jgi:DNA-binding NarL/FixJ family response regulator